MTNRILALHDLSCFGRSALQVIIPTLSSFGKLTCPVPTAVLSTHTGGFEDFTFIDLTTHMKAQLNHWKSLDLEFLAIYPGFLGSAEQVAIVKDYISTYKKENTLLVIDPVLGDEGAPYSSITKDLIKNMQTLIKGADLITPNQTEANLLLGNSANSPILEKDYLSSLKNLAKLGSKKVIITSLETKAPNTLNLLYYDSKTNEALKLGFPKIKRSYPGTGDAFGALILGHLLDGVEIKEAIIKTVSFLHKVIKATNEMKSPIREGLYLEPFLAERKRFENPLESLNFEALI